MTQFIDLSHFNFARPRRIEPPAYSGQPSFEPNTADGLASSARDQETALAMLALVEMIDTYGPDKVLSWWRGIVRTMEPLSPGTIEDPRR